MVFLFILNLRTSNFCICVLSCKSQCDRKFSAFFNYSISTNHNRFEFLAGPLFYDWLKSRTTNAPWSLFSLKSRNFGLWQTNWTEKSWSIWGIFGQTFNTRFGTMSSLSMFSVIQPLFLQKHFSCLGLGFEFGPSCVRSPWCQWLVNF
mgnify:CR=1 FL=1